jgi:hypothetical protein
LQRIEGTELLKDLTSTWEVVYAGGYSVMYKEPSAGSGRLEVYTPPNDSMRAILSTCPLRAVREDAVVEHAKKRDAERAAERVARKKAGELEIQKSIEVLTAFHEELKNR